ncbi:IIA component of sugar transport PTS system [Advenella kashmirensis WT001]|uniref:IIA component of sugar transport PTS system n=1 Tax=Advenella kashmirensis (strain DSM 17095 / LMG 22695 / WT001) TaxID=1036672 RepID=I3UCE6_ADVKW|nr:IIA component of sugar transport PTS system [Advenella kashmirensis]AFK62684.1 IIA component of sugar transport PTS system [Advenella kashmirensis WT001]
MTTLALIAHTPLASALSECAQHVLGQIDNYVFFDIEPDVDPESKADELIAQLKAMLGPDQQVLILSDLGGATPANIGARVVRQLQDAGVKAIFFPAPTPVCCSMRFDIGISRWTSYVNPFLRGARKA